MDTEWVGDDICIRTELNLESQGKFLQKKKLYKFTKAFSSVHNRGFYLQLLRLAYSIIFSNLPLPIALKGVPSMPWHMALTPHCTGLCCLLLLEREVSDSLCPPRVPRLPERSVVRKSSKKRVFQLAVYEEHNECHSQEQKEKQNDVSHQVWLVYFPFF